jgi:fructose-specific phosphotransferase system IIC component
MKDALIKLRQYLLSGVSFAIPFIACGGIMIAAAIGINARYSPNAPGDFTKAPHTLKLIMDIGVAAFTLMPAVLAGYVSYAMAGKPGLVPGMVGGWLATHLGVFVVTATHTLVATPDPGTHEATAGFLGALVAGLLAGWMVNIVKQLPVPKYIRPIMPILIIPIISSMVIGFIMLKLVGVPIAQAMASLGGWLDAIGKGNGVLLAIVLGVMIAFDMGGPINKAAFFFGAGLVAEGHFAVMGCVAAAICTPPLGMGLATLLNRSLWREEEKEAGIAALAMGMIGITEGAIPFAAADPLRVIPCICFGSAVAAVIAMLGGVGDHAPHGGPIVLPVVDHRVMYVIAIAAGTFATAVAINSVKSVAARQTARSNGPASSTTPATGKPELAAGAGTAATAVTAA